MAQQCKLLTLIGYKCTGDIRLRMFATNLCTHHFSKGLEDSTTDLYVTGLRGRVKKVTPFC